MAVQVLQEVGSKWKTSKNGNAQYTVFALFDPATDDEADVQLAVQNVMPPGYVGFVLRDIDFTEISHGYVRAVGNYSRGERIDEPGVGNSEPSEFAFEIDSQQTKIFSSYSVISQGNASGETSPDNGTLIGVKPDGTIDGVDVPQMTYSFSETHHFATMPDSYKITLASLVGTVNFSAPFRIGAAGEVMLAGVSGSQRGDELWKVRYRFQVLPNITSQTIGPVTVTKAGWDYVEFFTRDRENTTTKKVERVITGYKVHRVMRAGNFALLGIGS